jgi:hypothetical protein
MQAPIKTPKHNPANNPDQNPNQPPDGIIDPNEGRNKDKKDLPTDKEIGTPRFPGIREPDTEDEVVLEAAGPDDDYDEVDGILDEGADGGDREVDEDGENEVELAERTAAEADPTLPTFDRMAARVNQQSRPSVGTVADQPGAFRSPESEAPGQREVDTNTMSNQPGPRLAP